MTTLSHPPPTLTPQTRDLFRSSGVDSAIIDSLDRPYSPAPFTRPVLLSDRGEALLLSHGVPVQLITRIRRESGEDTVEARRERRRQQSREWKRRNPQRNREHQRAHRQRTGR